MDSLLTLLSESPILVGDGGLNSCFHWTWFFALSKQHFPPHALTPLLLVPTIYSHGLMLNTPYTSPRQLLTLQQFCQSHLSRSKSDHTNCLLQTLPQLLNSSGTKPRCFMGYTKTFGLCSLGPTSLQALLFPPCSTHCPPSARLQIDSAFCIPPNFAEHLLDPPVSVAQMVKFCLQCGRPGFEPWVGKIPWRKE